MSNKKESKKESPLDDKNTKRIGRIVHKDGSVSIVEAKGFPCSDEVCERLFREGGFLERTKNKLE